MLIYKRCGCEVRPLQIGGAHTCAFGPKPGRARCVRATQKMVTNHALEIITQRLNLFLKNYMQVEKIHFEVEHPVAAWRRTRPYRISLRPIPFLQLSLSILAHAILVGYSRIFSTHNLMHFSNINMCSPPSISSILFYVRYTINLFWFEFFFYRQ